MRTQIAIAAIAALILAASASAGAAPPPKGGPKSGPGATMLNPQPEPPNRHGHERDVHRCETPTGEYAHCDRALCRDHTVWTGTDRRDACMRHNGVDRWL